MSTVPMVRVKKPRISGPKLDRLCRRLSTWRWQTKGRRIECIRHHLKNEVLPRYTQTELAAALTWAEIGKGGKPAVFDDVYATVMKNLEGRDVVNVIYHFDGMEDFIPEGLAMVTGNPGKNPETHEECAEKIAVEVKAAA